MGALASDNRPPVARYFRRRFASRPHKRTLQCKIWLRNQFFGPLRCLPGVRKNVFGSLNLHDLARVPSSTMRLAYLAGKAHLVAHHQPWSWPSMARPTMGVEHPP